MYFRAFDMQFSVSRYLMLSREKCLNKSSAVYRELDFI